MKIQKITLINYRIYDHTEVSFDDYTNIITGDNAQGKTSLLESMYLLGLTKSHRTNKETDVIKTQTDFAKINALINLNKKQVSLEVVVSKAGKKAKYNGIEFERLSEYIGILNVVMFAPEDLELVKGNPQNRRKFLDVEIGQISKDYIFNLQNYKKVLKQRNDLLKTLQKSQNKDTMLLDIITDQLIGYLSKIVEYRKQFVSDLNVIAKKIYKNIADSDKELLINYIPNVQHNIKQEFINKYQYDIITGTTNIGTHRDDLEFTLNETIIKTHGSQGELRTTVLAVKLALIEFIFKSKGNYPILLLDDVMSELDIKRQNNLLQFIDQKIQTFISTTDINNVDLKKINQYKIFDVKQGIIKECDTHGTKL